MIADGRDPSRVIHRLPNILRARILAIACGWEDADDIRTRRPLDGKPCLRGHTETRYRADVLTCRHRVASL